MKKRSFFLFLFPAASIIVNLSASDKLSREAATEEKTLGEISSRIKDIMEKQQESNVFTTKEVLQTDKKSESVDSAKNEDLKIIIESLMKTAANETKESKHKYYNTARDEYGEAIEKLSKLFESEKLKKTMEKRQLLEKQKELLNETKEFEEKLKQKDKLTGEDLEQFAELAEKEEDLKNEFPDKKDSPNLEKKMDDVIDSLQNMDLEEAKKSQEEIINDLEDAIKNDMENGQSEMADRLDDINQMEEDLIKMEQQLTDSLKQNSPLDSEERQEMAMDMNQLSEKMKDLAEEETSNMNEASEEMNDAVENLMAQQDKQALENVQDALHELKKEKEMLSQKTEDEPQNPHESDKPQDDEKIKDVKKNQLGGGEDWKAKLPENERMALLAARKAKFNPEMEETVKRYFIELAK